MNTRTARARGAATSGPQPAPWDALADLGRQQLSVATDASCAMLRGLRDITQIQQQAAQHASARQQSLANQLRQSCEPMDLMTLPAGLVRDELESAAQYWQQLTATALEMQTEMMACATHLVDSEAALDALSAFKSLDGLPSMTNLFPLKPSKAARSS